MSHMYIQAPHINNESKDIQWHEWARRDTHSLKDKWMNSRVTNLSKKYPNTVFRIYFYDRWGYAGKSKEDVHRYFKNGVEIPEPTFTLLVKVTSGYVWNGEVKNYEGYVTVEDGDEYFAWLLSKGVRSYSPYAFQYVEYDGKRRVYHNIGRNQTVEADWSEVETYLERKRQQEIAKENALLSEKDIWNIPHGRLGTDALKRLGEKPDLSGVEEMLNSVANQIEGIGILTKKDQYRDKLYQTAESLRNLAEWVKNG